MSQTPQVVHYATAAETERRKAFARMIRQCPIADAELINNVGLFLSSKTLARLKFMDHIYEKIVEIQGVVMEFGVRWGQNLSHFAALRGIHEPFNRHRKIIGFDTFAGFPAVAVQDGQSRMMQEGNYSVPPDYERFLERVLKFQEDENPLAHVKRFELVMLPQYLQAHPETIVALLAECPPATLALYLTHSFFVVE